MLYLGKGVFLKQPNDNGQSQDLTAPPVRSGMDINFARCSWIFASRATRGYRKLPAYTEMIDGKEMTYYVSVGTWRHTQETFNTDDELVFLAAYTAWEQAGRDMNNRDLKTFMNRALEWGNAGRKRRHYGARDFKKLQISVDKCTNIGVTFDIFETKNGGYKTKTIHLFEEADFVGRRERLNKGQRYFELSQLRLNESICQNIKDGKIKLFYLPEFRSLRNEAAKIIYNRLELLGGIVESPFRREIFSFSKECQIQATTNKVLLTTFRRACKELVGKKLTHGIISRCFVEVKKAHRISHWYFVCYVSKVLTTRAKETGTGTVHVVPDYRDLEVACERRRDEELREQFDHFPESEKEKIKGMARTISRDRYHGYSFDTALIDAIREYVTLANLSDRTKALVVRETCHHPYQPVTLAAMIKNLTFTVISCSEPKIAVSSGF